MTIPARLHFIWIGSSLPWAYVFAVLSATEKSGLDEIILHHTDTLEGGAELAALRHAPRVRVSRIDPVACLRRVGRALGVGDGLVAIYRTLARPTMQADVLRAAILYEQGGVYLDLDTITTASLLPLLGTPHFVGCEYIVWPSFVRASRSPILWARSLTLDLLRKVMRRMPQGWRAFRYLEKCCYRSVANGVMGAEAHSRLFSEYLHAMLAVPAERLTHAYALGPDLLQAVVDRYAHDDLTIEEPQVFYPLPPEVSEHWFRVGRRVRLDAVLSAKTRVVHWYASVHTLSRVALIDPAYVRERHEHQLYSALVCSCIRNLPEATNPCAPALMGAPMEARSSDIDRDLQTASIAGACRHRHPDGGFDHPDGNPHRPRQGRQLEIPKRPQGGL